MARNRYASSVFTAGSVAAAAERSGVAAAASGSAAEVPWSNGSRAVEREPWAPKTEGI